MNFGTIDCLKREESIKLLLHRESRGTEPILDQKKKRKRQSLKQGTEQNRNRRRTLRNELVERGKNYIQ